MMPVKESDGPIGSSFAVQPYANAATAIATASPDAVRIRAVTTHLPSAGLFYHLRWAPGRSSGSAPWLSGPGWRRGGDQRRHAIRRFVRLLLPAGAASLALHADALVW